jgi:hypothetical protein
MATTAVQRAKLDEKGTFRLGLGAGFGLAGAIVGIVLPAIFLILAIYNPGGFFTLAGTFLEVTGYLVLIGALLLLVSLFLYRRSYAALRQVDRRFMLASVLCLIGSIGFLLLLVTAGIVVGNSSSLVACTNGAASHILTCLKSQQPLGAYTGLIGFWLGWIGGVGIVLGLFAAGSRFQRGAYAAGAIAYALLLLILIGPFVGALVTIPDIGYSLLLVPVLGIVAPAAVLAGSRAPP